MIDLVVIANSPAFRTGLRTLLETSGDIEVIEEVASFEDLGDLPPTTDVILLSMGTSESEDLSEFLGENVHLPVLLLIDSDKQEKIPKEQLALRAWGILSSDATGEELVSAVSALHQGLWVSDPAFIDAFTTQSADLTSETEPLVDPLTNRELEVLQLLAQGLPNKQIALHLGISEHTIKFHISAIYAKLGATNRTEAVRIGVRLGLVLL